MALSIKHSSESSEANFNILKVAEAPGGVEKIALELLPPFIRETRDYEGFTRNLVTVHNVAGSDLHLIDGEPYVYYPKDFDSHAAFYAEDGQVPRFQIEGQGVNVGIMTVASDDITIHLKRLLVQRYDYVERTKEKSGQAIAKMEDTRFLNLVESLLMGDPSVPTNTVTTPKHIEQIVTSIDPKLEKDSLVTLKQCIDQHDLPVGAFVVNNATLSDMLRWQSGKEIDQLTQREMIESGVRYAIWGIPIISNRIIGKNIAYAFTTPEYLGRMPILKDLTIKLTDAPTKLEQGLFIYEFIGIYIATHKGIAKLVMDYDETASPAQPLIHLLNEQGGVVVDGDSPKPDSIGNREAYSE